MYLTFKDGECKAVNHIEKKRAEGREFVSLASYDEMAERAAYWGLDINVLEEARRFGYARYDSYEGFDCISLEMPDLDNIILSLGSVVIYMEIGRAFVFTSQIKTVEEIMTGLIKSMGERAYVSRIIYSFLELQTHEDNGVFDKLENEILALEQSIITAEKNDCVGDIIGLRKRLMVLKRYYEQLLNALDVLCENENSIFDDKTLRSFKMLYRRVERGYQSVLNLRDLVTQVRESYEAEVDISLNATMKLFTVVTTIFLPLTLIVGWYGMNLDMPEYSWRYGYLAVIVISVIFVGLGIYFFRKNKWF